MLFASRSVACPVHMSDSKGNRLFRHISHFGLPHFIPCAEFECMLCIDEGAQRKQFARASKILRSEPNGKPTAPNVVSKRGESKKMGAKNGPPLRSGKIDFAVDEWCDVQSAIVCDTHTEWSKGWRSIPYPSYIDKAANVLWPRPCTGDPFDSTAYTVATCLNPYTIYMASAAMMAESVLSDCFHPICIFIWLHAR